MRISDWSSDVCSSDLHTRSQLAKMLIRQVFTHQSSGLRRIDRQERTLVFVHVWMLRFVHRVAIPPAARSRDRKSTRLNSSHSCATRMPSSACKKKTHINTCDQ